MYLKPGSEPRKVAVRMVAGLLVGVGIVWWGAKLWGPLNPDWTSYERMYEEHGAWLSEYGRDPLFTWLLEVCRTIFGVQGYRTFRAVTLLGLAIAAAAFVARWPLSRRYSMSAVPVLACVGVALWAGKATVQIREGIALVFLLPALLRIIRRNRMGVASFASAVCSVLIHAGTSPYLVMLVVAQMAFWAGKGRPISTWLGLLVAVVGAILLGVGLDAWRVSEEERLLGYGFTRDVTEAQASWLKYLYWLLFAGVLVVLGRELRVLAGEKRGSMGGVVASIHGSVLLPLLLMLAIYWTISGQPLAAVAVVLRMLSTAASVAMAMVMLADGCRRGMVLACALFVIADQLRSIYVAA